MNFKTTIVLIVLLVVVGIVFFFNQQGEKKAPEQASEQTETGQGPRLINLSTDDVKGLTITDADGKQTGVARSGDTWTMTAPVHAAAVDWQTRNLVQAIVDVRSKGRPATVPGADAGLEKPRYLVQIDAGDGKTVRLAIGNRAGVGDVMYAQVDGQDINLIDSSLAKTLKTAADDVRDKHLMTIVPSDVKQVRLTYGNMRLVLADVNGKWEIQQPQAMPGDNGDISDFLSTVTGVEATEFLNADSDELTFAGFDHPVLEIWLGTEAPSTRPSTSPSVLANSVTLTVGAPDSMSKDHYLVKMSDGQYAKIAGSFVDNMKKTPLDLRDKQALTILPADVTSITITKTSYKDPPTTQATHSQEPPPLRTTTLTVIRRPKQAPGIVGPVLSTQPTTLASTEPSTKPAEPQSAWEFSDTKAPANEAAVDAVLARFNPLQASKYLEKTPDSYWLDHYVVTIETAGADHGPGKSYHVEFTRPTNNDNPYVTYDGLTFETTLVTLGSLDTDFQKPPP